MPLHGGNRQRPTNRKGVDMNKVSGIYRIDLGNGYFYIGSAVDLGRRKNSHTAHLKKSKHRNIKMQRCWDKYKIFEFTILEKCEIEFLLIREQIYLDKYKDNLKNINIASNAASPMLGRKHSAESRAKISKGNKGKKVSDEQRLNMSIAHKAKGMSFERKEALRTQNKNRIYTTELRAKMSASQKGKVKSPETCAKLSASLKGKPKSAEHRKNLSIAAKKRPPISEEHRMKLSMATKGKPKSAQTRANMVAAWVRRRAG
jgi:group I intron endonuclease